LDAPQRINLVAPIFVSIRKDRIIETAPEAGKWPTMATNVEVFNF
jgi:hypothetical protein